MQLFGGRRSLRSGSSKWWVLTLALVAVVALFLIMGPGPMAFSKGRKVNIADYHAANPSGVPAASPRRM